jgi:hypothetical protein
VLGSVIVHVVENEERFLGLSAAHTLSAVRFQNLALETLVPVSSIFVPSFAVRLPIFPDLLGVSSAVSALFRAPTFLAPWVVSGFPSLHSVMELGKGLSFTALSALFHAAILFEQEA